jgi:hypothetical protein
MIHAERGLAPDLVREPEFQAARSSTRPSALQVTRVTQTKLDPKRPNGSPAHSSDPCGDHAKHGWHRIATD